MSNLNFLRMTITEGRLCQEEMIALNKSKTAIHTLPALRKYKWFPKLANTKYVKFMQNLDRRQTVEDFTCPINEIKFYSVLMGSCKEQY